MPTPTTVGDRVDFWVSLHQRLGRLANRLDAAVQAKILGAVHARVPMPPQDEIQAPRLERAEQHETTWRLIHTRVEASVEANKALRDGASKMVAEGEPLLATASAELTAAITLRERIEQGKESGLPKRPPSPKQLGFSDAAVRHAVGMSLLTEEQFERFLQIMADPHPTTRLRRRFLAPSYIERLASVQKTLRNPVTIKDQSVSQKQVLGTKYQAPRRFRAYIRKAREGRGDAARRGATPPLTTIVKEHDHG